MYVCPKCKRVFDRIPEGAVRCPYCGYRVLFKAREPVVKVVKAI